MCDTILNPHTQFMVKQKYNFSEFWTTIFENFENVSQFFWSLVWSCGIVLETCVILSQKDAANYQNECISVLNNTG
jgi:hypothetical protein